MESVLIALTSSHTWTGGELHSCLVYWDAEQKFVLARTAVALVMVIEQLRRSCCSPYRSLCITMATVHLESSCSCPTTCLARAVVLILFIEQLHVMVAVHLSSHLTCTKSSISYNY